MKTTVFKLFCLLAAFVPLAANSQTNIKAAFDAIMKCPKAEVTDYHFLKKDKETNLKSGQDDVYRFVLPADRMDLIKNVLTAFDKDMASAYVVKQGENTGDKIKVQLYSEDSTLGDVSVLSVDDPGTSYIYELFAPSKAEDPDGNHRYAYAFNYKEKDGKIVGKMVINYALTSEYRELSRQAAQRQRDLEWTISLSKAQREESPENESKQSWFEQMMACVGGLDESSLNSKNRIALATKAYKLVKDVNKYPDVTVQDRTVLRQIFRTLKDKPGPQDPILKELLQQCENGLN